MLTSPWMRNVHEFSTISMLVIPSTLRAWWILAPWAPIARPIRSSLTANSSVNLPIEKTLPNQTKREKETTDKTEGTLPVVSHRSSALYPVLECRRVLSSCLTASSVLLSSSTFCVKFRKCISCKRPARFLLDSCLDWKMPRTCHIYLTVIWKKQTMYCPPYHHTKDPFFRHIATNSCFNCFLELLVYSIALRTTITTILNHENTTFRLMEEHLLIPQVIGHYDLELEEVHFIQR